MYLPLPNYLLTHLPRLQRLATSAFAGLCASVGLLWLMTQLIQTDENGYTDTPQITITDWVQRIEDDPVTPKPPKPLEPPKVEKEPELRPVVLTHTVDTGFGDRGYAPPGKYKPTIDVSPGLSDGDAIPIVRVQPQYPSRPASKGIEGYVVIGFSISPTGAVLNPVVVEASPAGVFDRAALAAVKKFKYKPKVIDQKAVAVDGVLHRIVFELED